jgi:hypothetical protein
MANVLTGRQLYADTPGTLWLGPLKINSIIYSDPLVAGNKCTLVDGIGRPVWNGLAGSDLAADSSNRIGWVNGLVLNEIDSGNVIVYLE